MTRVFVKNQIGAASISFLFSQVVSASSINMLLSKEYELLRQTSGNFNQQLLQQWATEVPKAVHSIGFKIGLSFHRLEEKVVWEKAWYNR